MILQFHVITSTCLTIAGVRTLATYFLPTKTTFAPNFTRFIGVEERRGLIVSAVIGALIIVGFTHLLELWRKFEENSKYMAKRPL